MSFSEAKYTINEISKKLDEKLDLDTRVTDLENNEKKMIIVSPIEPIDQPIGGIWFYNKNNGVSTSYYRIKKSDGTYGEEMLFCSDGENVLLDDGAFTLNQILRSFGTEINLCTSPADSEEKEFNIDSFIRRDGSKIFVYFSENNKANTFYFKIIGKTDRINVYEGDKPMDGNKLVANTVYQFIYANGNFYCLGGGSSSIASDTTIGGIKTKPDGDITVSEDGIAEVLKSRYADSAIPTPHASADPDFGKATETEYGHVKLTDDLDKDDPDLASSVIATRKVKAELDTLTDTVKANENILVNGTFEFVPDCDGGIVLSDKTAEIGMNYFIFKGFESIDFTNGLSYQLNTDDSMISQNILNVGTLSKISNTFTLSVKCISDLIPMTPQPTPQKLFIKQLDKNGEEIEDGVLYGEETAIKDSSLTLEEVNPKCVSFKVGIEYKGIEGLENPVNINMKYIKFEVGEIATELPKFNYRRESQIAEKYVSESGCSQYVSINEIKENLVDNPDLSINQRNFIKKYLQGVDVVTDSEGRKGYWCHTPKIGEYGYDRWNMGINSALFKTDDGFKVDLNYNKDLIVGGFVRQRISIPVELRQNNCLTLSVESKESSNDMECYILGWRPGESSSVRSEGIMLNTSSEWKKAEVSLSGLNFGNYIYVRIQSIKRGSLSENKIISFIRNLKIEIGNTSSAYLDPIYEEEINKCQKYFQIVHLDELQEYMLTTGSEFYTKNVPIQEMKFAPEVDIVSNKYDCLFVDSSNATQSCPSYNYSVVKSDMTTVSLGYRTAGGSITTSTKKNVDLGYGVAAPYGATYFSEDDFEKDKNLLQILGKSAKSTYFFPRRLNVNLICNADYRVNKKPTSYWKMNFPASSVTSSNKDPYAYYAFRWPDSTSQTGWTISGNSTFTVEVDTNQTTSFYGYYFAFISTNKIGGIINIYFQKEDSQIYVKVSQKDIIADGQWNNYIGDKLLGKDLYNNNAGGSYAKKIKIEVIPNGSISGKLRGFSPLW